MKKISILLMTVLGLFFANCDNEFESVNQDGNLPTAVPSHLLLGNIVRVNQNIIYGMQQGGDMGMCWSQHVSKVQYNSEELYIPRLPSIDAIWNTLYSGVIQDAKSMYALADAEGNDNIKGIALILEANAFQILTDLYGPIPYTEAVQPGNFKPAYDTQEVVYQGILDKLTQADALLATGVGSAIPVTSDIVYGGNTSKWRKFANSLKLKALIRISKVKDVASQIQTLVSAGNLMTSSSDSAQLVYLGSQPDANPIYETIIYNVREEYKLSSVLVERLTTLADPRLAVYGSKNDAGLYVGNIPGIENSGSYKAFSGLGSTYLDPKLPGVMLSYAEVQFCLAEAANEGYIAGGTTQALNYFNNAVSSNFAFNGLTAAAATSYLAQPSVSFLNKIDAQNKIGQQKWIALFGQGFEAWTEWRRTGLPALSPAQNATIGIPSRLFYNSTEITLNKSSYSTAIGLLVGGDQLTSRLWWMN